MMWRRRGRMGGRVVLGAVVVMGCDPNPNPNPDVQPKSYFKIKIKNHRF